MNAIIGAADFQMASGTKSRGPSHKMSTGEYLLIIHPESVDEAKKNLYGFTAEMPRLAQNWQ